MAQAVMAEEAKLRMGAPARPVHMKRGPGMEAMAARRVPAETVVAAAAEVEAAPAPRAMLGYVTPEAAPAAAATPAGAAAAEAVIMAAAVVAAAIVNADEPTTANTATARGAVVVVVAAARRSSKSPGQTSRT